MAQRVPVGCINKTDRSSAHERIRNIGGINIDGTRWTMTQDQAIQAIKDGRYSFYVEPAPGRLVDVVIARRLGREYLKTTADGDQPDNLLALRECPS